MPRSLPDPSRRPLLGALLVIALATSVAGVGVAASAGPIDNVDSGADVGPAAVAERGQRVQVDPFPLQPVVGGCTVGTVTKVASWIDSGRRWSVGTASANWGTSLRAERTDKGPVVVVGDSLTLAAMEETMRYLVNAGYGPICIDGGVSRRVDPSSASKVSSGVEVIARIKASDAAWAQPDVRWVLAFGTNDINVVSTSAYDSTIQHGIAAIGTTTQPIRWVDVRTRRDEDPVYGSLRDWRVLENTWNARLVAAGLRVIGWSAATASAPWKYIIALPDYIHLVPPTGEVLRGNLIGQSIVAG